MSTDTKTRYTGKEHDDEEIEQDYFGARYLNGVTRRFNSVDPKEDKYPGWSPYVYTLANSIMLVDPDGEGAKDVIYGIGDAIRNNLSLGTYSRQDPLTYPVPTDLLAGQIVGDALSSLTGAAQTIGGAGGAMATVLAAPATGGTSLLATPALGLETAYGAGLLVQSGANLGKDLALLREASGSGQSHHIATDKSIKSGYTGQLQEIFDKGGMNLQDKSNKLFLDAHKGRHSTKYHEYVIKRLTEATKGLTGEGYMNALRGELDALGTQIQGNPEMLKGEGLP